MSFVTGTQAELLYAMPQTGASVTNTVSTASTGVLTPTAGATFAPFLLSPYFFPSSQARGTSILIQGGGTLLNGPATQTLRFGLYMNTTINVQATGGTTGSLLCATGAFSPFGANASLTGAFMFEALASCTAAGTAGTLNTVGRFTCGQAGNTGTLVAASTTVLMGSATQPTFDNSKAYYIEAYANFGATTTVQAVTLTNFLVWGLN